MRSATITVGTNRHIFASIKDRLLRLSLSARHSRALDQFVKGPDSARNAVNLFRGKWVGAFPPELQVEAGAVPLYDDPRLNWMGGQFDLAGFRVLELGPLEGGHTCQLLRMGADTVTAIESNGTSYMKCLITREVLGLDRAKFLCADCVSWLEQSGESFDLCVASGLLYHMVEPLKVLGLIASHTDRVFIWTHYYDEERIRSNRHHAHRFRGTREMEWGGYRAAGHYRSYGAQVWNPLHLGGDQACSYWITRDDLLGALRHYGLTDISIGPEEPDHPAGPALSLTASRPA